MASDALIKSSKKQQSIDQQQQPQTPNSTPPTAVPGSKSPLDSLRQRANPQFMGDKDLIDLSSSPDSAGAGSAPVSSSTPGLVDDDVDDLDEDDPDTEDTAPISPSTADFEIVSRADVNQAMDTIKHQQLSAAAAGSVNSGFKGGSVAGQQQQQPPQQQLRDGFVWQKQLVFRSKLTMHTAFERKDNKEPAAVTCISVAK